MNNPSRRNYKLSIEYHSRNLKDMDPRTLYRILKLRSDVFVVEQSCAYPELDGRDLEEDSLQVWCTKNLDIPATLRILTEEQSLRIGRVVADKNYRGTGIARDLFTYALNQCSHVAPHKKIVLDAQAPLQAWYESFGFTRAGEEFLEDGIPHVPMLK